MFSVYSQVDFNLQQNAEYGNSLFVLADIQVVDYLNRMLEQVLRWLPTRTVTHLVLVFLSKSTGKTLERWTFDLRTASSNSAPFSTSTDSASASIQNLLKQIPSAASFLPDLPEPVVFNILVYKRDEPLSPSLGEVKVGKAKTESKTPAPEEGWRDVTEEAGTMAFETDMEVQNMMLRGIKTNEVEVNLMLSAIDD